MSLGRIAPHNGKHESSTIVGKGIYTRGFLIFCSRLCLFDQKKKQHVAASSEHGQSRPGLKEFNFIIL